MPNTFAGAIRKARFFFLLSSLVFFDPAALACSRPPPPPLEDEIKSHQFVFEARVLFAPTPDQSIPYYARPPFSPVLLFVTRVEKGAVSLVSVVWMDVQTSCGIDPRPGARVSVLANRSNGRLLGPNSTSVLVLDPQMLK